MKTNFSHSKTIYLSLLFSCILSASFSQFTNDRYHIKDSLEKHNVSAYKIYRYTNEGKDSTLKEILHFDRRGNLIKEIEPDYNISISYKYDSLDRLIEVLTICPGIIYEKDEYFYDSDNMVKWTTTDSTGFEYFTSESFYEKSRLKKRNSIFRSKTNKTSRKSETYYKYDKDSLGLRIIEFNTASKLNIEKVINEYGGIIYYNQTHDEKATPNPVWFTYNKDLRVEQYRLFKGQKIVEEIMIYDDFGLITEIQTCNLNTTTSPCVVNTRFFYEYFSK